MPDKIGQRTIAGPVSRGAIYTKFLVALAAAYDLSPLQWLTQNMGMDDLKEMIGGLGSTPALRKHDGMNKFQNLTEDEILLICEKFQSGFEYDEDLPNHKIWSLISPKISQLAQRCNDHGVLLLTQTIEDNPICYDGKALFANDHPLKDGGVNKNLQAGSGITLENITADYWLVVKLLREMKDDQNQNLNRRMTKLLVHAHPKLEEHFTTLQLAASIGGGDTNILRNRFELWIDPNLEAEDDWYTYVTGEAGKLIMHGEYLKPTIKTYKNDDNDLVKVSAKRIHGMIPGDYSLGVKVDNT